jgi:predicted lactoylglutathione lyase
MATKIFLNLPVADLPRSIEFFKQLGYTFNPQFTDDTATCMIITEDIYVMLLTHPKFKSFTPKEIADAHKVSEVFIVLSCENRAQVDDTIRKAVAASCTATASSTSTATLGNIFIWTRASCSRSNAHAARLRRCEAI